MSEIRGFNAEDHARIARTVKAHEAGNGPTPLSQPQKAHVAGRDVLEGVYEETLPAPESFDAPTAARFRVIRVGGEPRTSEHVIVINRDKGTAITEGAYGQIVRVGDEYRPLSQGGILQAQLTEDLAPESTAVACVLVRGADGKYRKNGVSATFAAGAFQTETIGEETPIAGGYDPNAGYHIAQNAPCDDGETVSIAYPLELTGGPEYVCAPDPDFVMELIGGGALELT